jgi:hypothetical protein
MLAKIGGGAVLVGLTVVANVAGAQTATLIGGERNFAFLEQPASARLLAIGGHNVSAPGDDPALALYNPALLGREMHGRFNLSYNPRQAQTNNTTVYYAHYLGDSVTVGGGLSYNNYGTFEQRDAGGNAEGSFTAADYYFVGTISQRKGNFRSGLNLKVASSRVAGYGSGAIMLDLGTEFIHPRADLRIGAAIRNVGFITNRYTDEDQQLPLTVVLGASYKLKHMPIRFHLSGQQVNRWNLVYQDPANTRQDANGNQVVEKITFFDKFSRHLVFGAELLLGKGLHVRAGYNHLINRDLRLEDISGGAGFSLGAMVRLKAFEFSYGYGFYSAAGGVNSLTMVVDLPRIFRKKTVSEQAENPTAQ